ncbi:MAG: hypothetical protein U0003_04245 [Vampirovibrionales bacterium]
MLLFTSLRRTTQTLSLILAIGLIWVIGQASVWAGITSYKAKPFNIVGQSGAIYKSKQYEQEFLTLKQMHPFLAGHLFGNLNNKVLVQQLSQQVLGASKKGKNIRLSLRQIDVIGQGSMNVPTKLTGDTTNKAATSAAAYQHVRAHFQAYDKQTGNILKGKDASRSMDLMVIRLTPEALTKQGKLENVLTVYNMDQPLSAPLTQQFINHIAKVGF